MVNHKSRKYVNRIEQLRAAIHDGRLLPGEMVGTESAFSQEWGLSRNTVRRGINTLITEGLLERRPGKGLFVRSAATVSKVVQVVVPNLAWSHALKIAWGAQQAGRQGGVQIQIYDAHGKMELDLEVVRRLPDRLIDGAILVSLHHPRFSEVLFDLKSVGYPFVLADQRLHDLEVPTVEIDNYRGGYLVGEKLAQLGHKRSAFVGPLSLHVLNDRLSGFRDATLDAGVLFDRSLVLDLGGEGLTDFLNNRAGMTADLLLPLLTKPDRPTAIFDASGDIAPEIYRAARQVGLRIPRDLSVVTFEDAPFCQILEPQIARLRHPWARMGEVALEMLVGLMETKTTTKKQYEHHVLPAEWEFGGSLAPPAP